MSLVCLCIKDPSIEINFGFVESVKFVLVITCLVGRFVLVITCLGGQFWDKLPEWIFENFEIARVKRGQFQIFKNHEGNVMLYNVILYFKLA